VTGAEYAEALRWKEQWCYRLRRVFREVDAIFSPTTPVPAPLADGLDFIETIKNVTCFTYPWSFAGVPSLAVPCGFSSGLMRKLSCDLGTLTRKLQSIIFADLCRLADSSGDSLLTAVLPIFTKANNLAPLARLWPIRLRSRGSL
jgi:hypothetical protein